MQGAWTEVYPFVDKRAGDNAQALGLSADPDDLAGLVSKADFPRFVAALVRVGDADSRDEVLRAAA